MHPKGTSSLTLRAQRIDEEGNNADTPLVKAQ